MDVVVEKYGSIVLDDLQYKPLDESDIVTYGDYEIEFLKKLWLLNGLHLKLAYFGISKDLHFIHEIFEYDESLSSEQNFSVWYDMNSRERSDWNEKPYTLKEAKLVFEGMYADVITI